MDQIPERSEQGGATIHDWVRTALADALMRIVDNDWLDICEVDRVARALEHIRSDYSLPSRVDKSQSQYAGLVALHCVNYREMQRATLAGVPDALMTVFGLNDKSGPLFLGPERWHEVRSHFQRQTWALSAGSAVAPMPDQHKPINSDARVARLPTWASIAKVRARACSAVPAAGMLLRGALGWTRAAWAQRARIWVRQLQPDSPRLFLPALSSPSHPPCHYVRKEMPGGAPMPVTDDPYGLSGPTSVGGLHVHPADAPADDTTRTRERRRSIRGGRQFPRDSQ